MAVLRVLVVDDEPAIRQVLSAYIKKAGHEVSQAGDGTTAVELLSKGDYDLCISDIRLPDFDGLEILRRTREAGIETLFLMITAFASVDTAINAMRLGAYDYLMKPLRNEDVLRRLEQIADLLGLQEENERLRKIVAESSSGEDDFVSKSPAMDQIQNMARKVARTSGTVLVTGKSGTGKTFIAKQIHLQSPRADKQFVSVNCGAIPENLLESEFFGHLKGAFTGADRVKKGLFREADGGTLFLDEVAELPLPLQVKLLNVLEDKEVRAVGSEQSLKVDVRIIAATNRNLEEMVKEGTFREDLYYRLNVLHIIVPPLRERREDLQGLIYFFIKRETVRLGLEGEIGIDPLAEDILVHHNWPGNLREMQNFIARSLIMAEGDRITVADLPPSLTKESTDMVTGEVTDLNSGNIELSSTPVTGNLRDLVRAYEMDVINGAIKQADGDRSAAAKKLGIGLSTLYRKLDETP